MRQKKVKVENKLSSYVRIGGMMCVSHEAEDGNKINKGKPWVVESLPFFVCYFGLRTHDPTWPSVTTHHSVQWLFDKAWNRSLSKLMTHSKVAKKNYGNSKTRKAKNLRDQAVDRYVLDQIRSAQVNLHISKQREEWRAKRNHEKLKSQTTHTPPHHCLPWSNKCVRKKNIEAKCIAQTTNNFT